MAERSSADDSSQAWNILVVDDEKDVHEITQLALKRRAWRKRSFRLTHCLSAHEAKEVLRKMPPRHFQVALVDVVMETQTAGLDLCREIRATIPSSLRIVLRTGQPGVAPEERVINDYDIDHYLSKPEVTPEKLFSVIRSCLRSSQDIATLLAFSHQLRNFTSALQTITTDEDLLVFMREGLKFLELKHQVRVCFVNNVELAPASSDPTVAWAQLAVRKAHEAEVERGKLVAGERFGVEKGFVLRFAVEAEGSDQVVRGGFVVDQTPEGFTIPSLQGDLSLFMQNWTIAYGALLLQQRVAREKLLNERMYVERIESIANMVTGVAHEINTPLGVASTANGMTVSLLKEILHTPAGPAFDELVKDVVESSELLTKNLERASRLVRSFKQLSVSQLSDERMDTDLASVIEDCIETMRVETKRRNVSFRTNWATDVRFPWIGFPGHMSQVLINLIQNTIRYAYPNETPNGLVDVRLFDGGESYRLEFEDYGAGVAPDIFGRMFEPFVTSGRAQGGSGLGLAITHNIVTNLLKGQITCKSEVGKGTKFTLDVPKVIPE